MATFSTNDPITGAVLEFPTWESYEAWVDQMEKDHPEVCLWLKPKVS